MKALKGILKFLLVILLVAVLALGAYVGYIVYQYHRIADYTPLDLYNHNPQSGMLVAGEQYTAVTYNIGFGAYDQQFSFFMDEGIMNDGTPVKGEYGRAESAASIISNVEGAAHALREYDPDFVLLQEVDKESYRSYDSNQVEYLSTAFPLHSYVYASNFHTPFLLWPPTNPIGETESGLVTFSRYEVADSIRRSYPVDESFPAKLFDLDRCFSAQWLPVEGSTRQLVLINSHMSAYDEGGQIRTAQLQMLIDMMADEYEKGNYVIVGGDFNHALGIALDAFESQQQVPDWVVELDLSDLPAGFNVAYASNMYEVPTCRSADIPYTKGVNFTTVIDGFIVSDNIVASAWNIDLDFIYSDHNPVQLTFQLVPYEDEGAEEAPPEEGAEGEGEAPEGGEEAPEGEAEPETENEVELDGGEVPLG